MAYKLADLPRADDWWSVTEVAEYAGITRNSVNVYVMHGAMPEPSHRIGGNRVWRPDVIREWHDNRNTKRGPKTATQSAA